MDEYAYALWLQHSTAPYHFPMSKAQWENSMFHDVDSDGRTLFSDLQTICRPDGLIQFGSTAFGFDGNGEISPDIHHKVIRQLCFHDRAVGQDLLQTALACLDTQERIWAYFHYFGMSACARHGKLHEKDAHIAQLLLDNGFTVEHENVYYSLTLTDPVSVPTPVQIQWQAPNQGNCREFTAMTDHGAVGWGQVHFLPQGDIAYLRWIYIDGSRQHQGYGSATMHALICQLYRMGIRRFDTDTAMDNRIAQRYYEKCGFANEGVTRSYYKEIE